MTRRAFVGIDVAFAKGKRLPVVITTWQAKHLVPLPLREMEEFQPPEGEGNVVAALEPTKVRNFCSRAVGYVRSIAAAQGLEIACVAIDAPSDPCGATQPRRLAEIAMDKSGISCFATPTIGKFEEIKRLVGHHIERAGPLSRLPHSNQLWMLVGFELFRQFRNVSECREVFPQAIARAIGSGEIHKAKKGGVLQQLAAVAPYTGWPRAPVDETELRKIAWGPAHDALDAYLSAWVAALSESELIAYGEPPNDVIWVPKVGPRLDSAGSAVEANAKTPEQMEGPGRRAQQSSRARLQPAGGIIADTHGLTFRDVAGKRVLCPACREKVFAVWPAGWDAHSAHKCAGLRGRDPEARKREFKRRFALLFREFTRNA